ncbi:MAG TPA: alpha-2-macroglobulin family protein [Candidatus Methylacidiphilales bacterium]|nr:alpha-2-macroglobulin family protein [Candidatus Methylacidiphilales bacterium]
MAVALPIRGSATPVLAEAERLRVDGKPADSITLLAREAAKHPESAESIAMLRLAIWHSLPAEGDRARKEAGALSERLASAAPGDEWGSVYRLYFAAVSEDRASLKQAAVRVLSPRSFPIVGSEEAYRQWCKQAAVCDELDAGLQIITHRNFDPLFALRDLDLNLTRQADYMKANGDAPGADALLKARDVLRAAWLKASRHTVERLFALALLNQTDERNKLMAALKSLDYLGDTKRLREVLTQLGREAALQKIVTPMLRGDLELVLAPPSIPAIPAGNASVSIESATSLKTTLRQNAGGTRLSVVEGSYTNSTTKIRGLSIRADRLTATADSAGSQIFTWAGDVKIDGHPSFPGGITAHEARMSADTLLLDLKGQVTLKSAGAEVRWTQCKVDISGKVTDQRDIKTDFAAAKTTDEKLAVARKMHGWYPPEQMPPEACYLAALDLLLPHLEWRPGFTNWDDAIARSPMLASHIQRMDGQEITPWREAHPGEDFMHSSIPQSVKEEAKRRFENPEKVESATSQSATAQRLATAYDETRSNFYWLLKDSGGKDQQAAMEMLASIPKDAPQFPSARRWLADLYRNNTVLTMDVPPDVVPGKEARIMLDVRAAESVKFRLYRLRNAEELASVCERIGTDFLFNSYQEAEILKEVLEKARAVASERYIDPPEVARRRDPAWYSAELPALFAWEVNPARLPIISHARRSEMADSWEVQEAWSNEPDGDHFGDACTAYSGRIDRVYDEYPDDSLDRLSSWQVAREVRIPGKYLVEPGAYVIVAEANGQRAFAPLLVDSLTLVARRCRDGIMALVSSPNGKVPVAEARFAGTVPILNPNERSDANGAAFVKMSGAGDRALVVEQAGRYAVAGFGRVFQGLYVSRENERNAFYSSSGRLRATDQTPDQSVAHVFQDHLVAAGWTDRPTYRPGQLVQAKLFVRTMAEQSAPAAGEAKTPASNPDEPRRFRDKDFDLAAKLALLPVDTELPYEVLDPKGREIESGTVKTSEFGTAVLNFTLSPEAAVGKYALRLRHEKVDHVIPDLFRVMYYRRPNFEVKFGGDQNDGNPPAILPAAGGNMQFRVSARYYFGRPVGAGKARIRLVRPGVWRPLLEAEEKLSPNGEAQFSTEIPESLGEGRFLLIAEVSDESGRTVVASRAISGRGDPTAKSGTGRAEEPPLAGIVPRFMPVGQKLVLPLSGGLRLKRLAGQPPASGSPAPQLTPPLLEQEIAASNGTTELSISKPGWYEVTARGESVQIYAYPEKDDVTNFMPQESIIQREKGDEEEAGRAWVNLASYRDPFAFGGSYEEYSPMGRPSPVWALFEGHHGQVGGKVRVLLRVPGAPCRVAISVEGRTVVDYQIVQVTQTFQVVEIPITSRWLPNVFLQACVIDGTSAEDSRLGYVSQAARQQEALDADDGDVSEDPRWCRVDVADPQALAGGEELNVTVTADRAEYRPGESVQVDMTVTGKDGKPRQAELALAAVDDSIYTFGESQEATLAATMSGTAAPRRFMDKPWRRSLNSELILKQLQDAKLASREAMAKMSDAAQAMASAAEKMVALEVQKPQPEIPPAPPMPLRPTDATPVGEIPIARLRQDFRETAAWLPQIRTDAHGKATASFKLPDTLTRYRLTAVGITRQTEIGSGRGSLRASMPLSVQLFLPRFGVEGDQLEVVGLVHNATTEPQDVDVMLDIVSAGVDLPAGSVPKGWFQLWLKSSLPHGVEKAFTRTIRVPAGGQERVTLPVSMLAPGEAKFSLTATASGSAKEADAEERTLRIYPWGRAREVVEKRSIKPGGDNPDIMLPEGFVVDTMQVSLMRQSPLDVTEALEGIGYLIGYPYGCVEQTMSRLMPAIVVRDASRNTAFALPADVVEKLPEVIDRGLLRIYNFQHEDGGWGWWEKDATNDRMSVYVLYGLARCSNAGVAVNPDVMRRGLAWLTKKLANDSLEESQIPRAWLVLALALPAHTWPGVTQEDLQKTAAKYLADHGPKDYLLHDGLAELALACREAGLPPEAAHLWAKARAKKVAGVPSLALRLAGQFAFREPLDACYATARDLTALRIGYQFGSTWDTSRAIDGLARIIPLLPPPAKPADECHATAILGADTSAPVTLLDSRNAASSPNTANPSGGTTLPMPAPARGTRQHYASRTLTGGQLSTARNVQLIAGGPETYEFMLQAKGWQRSTVMEPVGDAVRLTRAYSMLNGSALPAEGIKPGDVFEVALTLEIKQAQEFILVEDRRPAGCEFGDDTISGPAAAQAAHHELRDDRICFFFTHLPAGRHTVTYLLRAETPGISHVLPGIAYPMYQEKTRGETASDIIRVKSL